VLGPVGSNSIAPLREAYYDWRAPEYDDFWNQRRLYTGAPEDWFMERDAVLEIIGQLPPARTLDVACGTGFITRRIAGPVTALDQSPRMLELARKQAPNATFVQGSAFDLPFPTSSFDRVFSSHFYGHLEEHERATFLREARRVAGQLIVLDAGLHGGPERAEWQERELNDGTQWVIYKRFFSVESLLAEIGGGEVLFSGAWFVCVRSRSRAGET
jgi:ubiquinone/menaquinone biosynthesis C-methylase UbiE